MRASAARAIAAACLTLPLLGSCGDDDGDHGAGDADVADAADGPAGGRGGSGAPPDGGDGQTGATGGGDASAPTPPAMVVMCGSTECTVDGIMSTMGVAPCCLADDRCGASSPLDPAMCLEPHRPGGPDLSCAEFVLQGFIEWGGCCTPEGQCGALDNGTFGCIPNGDLGLPESSCVADPDNTCERLVEVNCDGAEDCPGDQMCCGQYLDGYRRFVCRDDCLAAEADEGGIWSEICHPGADCSVANYTCRANTTFLPEFLYRCRDTGTEASSAGSTTAGEINCGGAVCGDGEKCCLSIPGAPRCVAASSACTCYTPDAPSGNDGGADDAG